MKEVNSSIAASPAAPGNRLPPFAALRAFEAVFRLGGLRRAASELGINHAVVSRHLKLIEQWLGAPLITREGRQLALTPDGQAYHARVSAAIAEMGLATDELLGRRSEAPVRLWCVPGLSIQWLSDKLAAFEQRYPHYQVELKPTDVPANLSIHEADSDIRYVRDDDIRAHDLRGVRSFELARPDVLAVASPRVAPHFERIFGEDISSFPFLHEENDLEWRAWLNHNEIVLPGKIPGMLCWHAHLAIAAARLGRGVALASRFLIDADLIGGTLVPVRLHAAKPVPIGAYVMRAREDHWSMPALRDLRHFLREEAAEMSPLPFG